MKSINEVSKEIISEFSLFEDWMDKYNLLIEMGKSLPILENKYKTPKHLISGCQSKVWLYAEYKNEKVFFTADGDAVITKGLIFLLVRVLSGQKAEDIFNTNLSFLDEIGLKEHLSPTRSNGLLSMTKQMKLYAKVFQMKYESKKALSHDKREELKSKVEDALSLVFDPEIPVNILELGLIYEINILDTKNCKILMTLTSPNCPVAESLPKEVEETIQNMTDFEKVEVEITFEPPWTDENMSEAAKLELGLL